MSKSKENDHGRYFEYLVSKKIHDEHKVSLTKRAQNDQIRDSEKRDSILPNKLKSMDIASEKICLWANSKLVLGKESILDRLPDREFGKQTHEDISITDNNKKKLSFSLKHNHDAIFHGRIGSVASNNWLGTEDNQLLSNFEKNKRTLIFNLQKSIPVGAVFAGSTFDESKRKGVKKVYWQIWKNFIEDLHNEVMYFFDAGVFNNKTAAENLFKKIVGSGRNQHRVLKKGNRVLVQSIENLKMPKKLSIKNIQIPNEKDPRSFYVWHLLLEFDNGMTIKGRTKQDGIIMKARGPDIKTDWRVIEWGDCGMFEEEL